MNEERDLYYLMVNRHHNLIAIAPLCCWPPNRIRRAPSSTTPYTTIIPAEPSSFRLKYIKSMLRCRSFSPVALAVLCWAGVLFADSLTRPSNSCASCDSIGEMRVDYDESLFLLAGKIHRPRKKDNEQKSIQRPQHLPHDISESLSLECLQPIIGPGDQKKKKKIDKNKTIVPYVPSRIGDAESILGLMLDSW
jgi:hypothetical protein